MIKILLYLLQSQFVVLVLMFMCLVTGGMVLYLISHSTEGAHYEAITWGEHAFEASFAALLVALRPPGQHSDIQPPAPVPVPPVPAV